MRNRFKLLTFKKRSIIKFIFIYIPIIITLNILVKIFPLPIYLLYPMITILLIGTTYIHLKHIKNISMILNLMLNLFQTRNIMSGDLLHFIMPNAGVSNWEERKFI